MCVLCLSSFKVPSSGGGGSSSSSSSSGGGGGGGGGAALTDFHTAHKLTDFLSDECRLPGAHPGP